jgi:hypothetical protein
VVYHYDSPKAWLLPIPQRSENGPKPIPSPKYFLRVFCPTPRALFCLLLILLVAKAILYPALLKTVSDTFFFPWPSGSFLSRGKFVRNIVTTDRMFGRQSNQ